MLFSTKSWAKGYQELGIKGWGVQFFRPCNVHLMNNSTGNNCMLRVLNFS